ncbi:hypothetical protein NEUTE2DRAFT_126427 [Neurospora tetrasperma FGSC 2509]|nr:hypothetical protein NEUTE2DRAFT_126427 [Neurospora tetrasperma FGSC 2509]
MSTSREVSLFLTSRLLAGFHAGDLGRANQKMPPILSANPEICGGSEAGSTWQTAKASVGER